MISLKKFLLVVFILLQTSSVQAARYLGENIDGFWFIGTAFSHDEGKYYNCEIEFTNDQAKVLIGNKGYVYVTLDNKDIFDLQNIYTYSTNPKQFWTLSVSNIEDFSHQNSVDSQKNDRWIVFHQAKEVTIYFDKYTYKIYGNTGPHIEAWIKCDLENSYILQHVFLNINELKYLIKEFVAFSKNSDEVIKTNQASRGWRTIVPGTNNEKIYKDLVIAVDQELERSGAYDEMNNQRR